MKLGIHAYEWCSAWSNETLWIIDEVKKQGFDFIEIPLMCLEDFDSQSVKARLEGLDIMTSTVILHDSMDITSFDEDARRNGVQYLKDCVRKSAEAGAKVFGGVLHSKYLKDAKCMPSEQEWEFSANSLKEVARYAQDFGVSLALEPVTRYESYLVNTAEQGVRLCKMIDEPNVYVHLDSYHMNIEEKDFYEAVKQTGSYLSGFHMCENDRGIPGSGHIDWDGIFRAFKEIGFDGYLGFEGFADCTDNMSTWVWRKLAPDGETFVREGLKFAREMMKKYDL